MSDIRNFFERTKKEEKKLDEKENSKKGVAVKTKSQTARKSPHFEAESAVKTKAKPAPKAKSKPKRNVTKKSKPKPQVEDLKKVSPVDFFGGSTGAASKPALKSGKSKKIPDKKIKKKREVIHLEDEEEYIPEEEDEESEEDYVSEHFSDEELPSPAKPKKVVKRKTPEITKVSTPTPKKKTKKQTSKPKSASKPSRGWYPNMNQAAPPNLGMVELPVGAPDCLSGLTFVITGVLDSLERDDAQDFIQKYGGRVTTSVSGKTSYLLSGTEPGMSKINKAKEKGIEVIDEPALLQMVRETCKQPEKPKKAVVPEPALPPPPTPTGSSAEENALWVDKYKPKGIEDIVGNKSCVDKLKQFLMGWNPDPAQRNMHAALLSGPPGIGKSTAAALVGKSLGYDVIEFNASDVRNKKSIEARLSAIIGNVGIRSYATNTQEFRAKSLVVMDEGLVDGMSSGDRGGMQELLREVKKSQIPFICICNDRASQKVQSLAKSCLDLRFRRPSPVQVAQSVMRITQREGFQVDKSSVEKLSQMCHADIRQVINTLQLWRTKQGHMSPDEVASNLKVAHKDFDLGPFDVVSTFFANTARRVFIDAGNESSWITDRINAYFVDMDILPLMVQEQYLSSNVRPPVDIDILDRFVEAADSISVSDVVSAHMRSAQAFSMMPLHAFHSCVYPGFCVSGIGGSGRQGFPQWLGKNSSRRKSQRLVSELKHNTSCNVSCSAESIVTDYLPVFRRRLLCPLVVDGKDGCSKVIDFMDTYNISLENYEAIADLHNGIGVQEFKVASNVKSHLTRTYKKTSHSIHVAPSKKKASKNGERGLKMDLAEEDDDHIGGLDDDFSDGGSSSSGDDALVVKKNAKKKSKKASSRGKPKSKGKAAKRPRK